MSSSATPITHRCATTRCPACAGCSPDPASKIRSADNTPVWKATLSPRGLDPGGGAGWRIRGLPGAHRVRATDARRGAVIDNSRYRRAEPCGGACLARRMGADRTPESSGATAAPEWANQTFLDLERFRAKAGREGCFGLDPALSARSQAEFQSSQTTSQSKTRSIKQTSAPGPSQTRFCWCRIIDC